MQEYCALAGEGAVDTVVCAVPDSYGRLMGKRLTPRSFRALALDGDGVRASTYLFATDVEMEPMNLAVSDAASGYADFRMVPDLSTLRRVPWEPHAVLVLCDAYQEHSDELLAVAPRSVLRAQLARAAGYDLGFRFASELEFYLACGLDAGAGGGPLEGIPRTSRHRMDYSILQGARDEWLIRVLRNGLDRLGIPVEASKPEWGLGQQEITIEHAPPLAMADHHVLLKHAVKQLAAAAGLTASFMAKPGIDEVGSSCHIHASLWTPGTGDPAGWDPAAPTPHLTTRFGQFLAGQLACAREIGLLWAPTVNSYKRYLPSAFAGTTLAAGHDNRSCGFRIVGQERSFRVENRIPGADVNPYHAYAATIAAGLHGIDQQLPAPAIYDGDAYADPSLPKMTTTMHQSIQQFRDSATARKAFGDQVHQHLTTFAATELARFEHHTVTDWEINRYFSRI
ncbi:MAG: glutamine synthetase family protein [Streptosporangiaceae bacterium]